eukprot:13202098-Alexandrium_andersonii.AAC.1
MSASLVGSEMCIRDSPQLPPSLKKGGASAERRAVAGLHFGGRTVPFGACLLYTSDAADDM